MRFFFAFITALFLNGLAAQTRFQHYPEGHELAYGTVQAMSLTKEGYLWLGGQTSLRRYDGSRLDFFGNRREDTTDLSNDYIRTLHQDEQERFWIGHNRGLSRFNFAREQFSNWRPPAPISGDQGRALVVYAVCSGRRDTLWVGTGGGLHAFDVSGERFIPDTALQRRQLRAGVGAVTSILREPDGNFLLGAAGGLFRFSPRAGSFELLRPAAGQPVSHLTRLNTDEVVIAHGDVLVRLQRRGRVWEEVHELRLPYPESSRFLITDLLITEGEMLYAGTTEGLFRVAWATATSPVITQFRNDPEETASLVSNSVFSLARTSDNVLLIGTRKGVDRLVLTPSPIEVIKQVPGEVALCDDITKGSAVDSVHNLLVVGTQSGLSIINLHTKAVRCYTTDNLPGLRKNYIFNVDPGPRPHTFWIGYRQGGTNLLVLDDPDRPTIEEVSFLPHDLGAAGVYEVVPDADGDFWLATSDGLFEYNYGTGNVRAYKARPGDSLALSTDNIFCTLTDSQGRQWVGTRNGGLCLRRIMDGQTTFECFRYDEEDPGSLPSDMVLNLFEDRFGRIWISNPEALAVYLEDGSFRTFGLADDLPYTICYGVFEDASGQLWAAFGGHFARLSLSEDGQFKLHDIVTRNSGLAGQANAQYGWSVLPDGRLALSQRDGLNLFHPDSIDDTPTFPEIILTDLELFDQVITAVPPEDNPLLAGVSIPDDINRVDALSLPPGKDFLSLRFSASEFRPDHPTFYSYRMSGIQEAWTDLGERNYLPFPKLPPGNYRLELRTGDARGRWSENIRTLDIYLAAPWYRRWWAIALFLLLALGAVYWLTRLREEQKQKIAAARRAERESFRRRSARDFHDEAGNHLSRVSLLTALAQREAITPAVADKRMQQLLADIDENVQVVREGMRDFIWALDPDNDTAYELGLRLKRFGQELFEHHPALFSAKPMGPGLRELNLRADQRRHLLLLFKEAMHNSFKHARAASEVTLSLSLRQGRFLVELLDNGSGFSTEEARNGAGMKNMYSRAEKLRATFTIKTDNGVSVQVTLPVDTPGSSYSD